MMTSPWQMVMVSSRYTTVCFQWVERLLHSNPIQTYATSAALARPRQAAIMQAALALLQVSYALRAAIRMIRSGPKSGLHARNTVRYNCCISVGPQRRNRAYFGLVENHTSLWQAVKYTSK